MDHERQKAPWLSQWMQRGREKSRRACQRTCTGRGARRRGLLGVETSMHVTSSQSRQRRGLVTEHQATQHVIPTNPCRAQSMAASPVIHIARSRELSSHVASQPRRVNFRNVVTPAPKSKHSEILTRPYDGLTLSRHATHVSAQEPVDCHANAPVKRPSTSPHRRRDVFQREDSSVF